ncbi:hypothetical protein [Clostridium algidicarnis]|uniref:Uncharacterized protein n=1 Tax=Clostridium algidicarnis DSM 15099 TaxID=1121295 RepID=A0A2S6FV54_9CLOT|nr:hypothetical protein [Clostridium algidicarnis]PPK45599.1 hypothetical protein BD821_11954 [Clostridium algidicarnis DSM 15099]
MGKRERRRKYKDVDARNLGVNQNLEHKNPNIITEKELIIIIILKLLSEKLKQNDSVINKDLQTKGNLKEGVDFRKDNGVDVNPR